MLRTILALTALLAVSPAWAIDGDGTQADQDVKICTNRIHPCPICKMGPCRGRQ